MRILDVRMYFVVLLFTSPVSAQIDVAVVSESIVRVRAYQNNKLVAEGSGFVLNDGGHVLTNAHLLADAKRLTVLSLKTGAEIVSQQVFAKQDMNLALLRVQGLGVPALSLSEQGAAVGRVVQTLKFGMGDSVQVSHGTIGTYYDRPGRRADDPVVHMLQHNAIVMSKAFGMPVFNECGDVIAINTPDPSGRWPFRKNAEPQGTVFALRSGDIITALKDREIAHNVVEEACLSAIERAEQESEAAKARADSIQAKADSIQVAKARADSIHRARADSIQAAKARAAEEHAARVAAERAKARADSANRAKLDSIEAAAQADSQKAAAATAVADSAKRASKQAQAKADSLKAAEARAAQRLQWSVIAGVVIVLLAFIGWFVSSRKKKAQLQNTASRLNEAEQEATAARRAAADAPQPAPFSCVLEGQDHTGRSFALRISALALGERAGVVLGRSTTKVDFMIDHEAVSREHIRLTVTGGNLYAEDLNTLNGTRINDHALNPREQALLQNNDQLELGPVVFQVRLVEE